MNSANVAEDTGFAFISDLANQLTGGKLDIPAFPDNALRIKSVLEDPNVTAEQVARVVGTDPVFTARLLKVANSVMVNGVGQKIDDIRTAISRMGFKVAHSTVMSVAVEQVMNSSMTEKLRPYLQTLWQHSVQVAAFSYVIAKKQTRIKPDTAMLAGLLHDIGKYYILVQSENYPELFNDPEVLAHIMDDWHTGIGHSILEGWNFSEELIQVADEHENIVRELEGDADLTDVVIIANLLSHNDGKSAETEIDWDNLAVAKRLKLTEQGTAEILDESTQEVQSIIQALEG